MTAPSAVHANENVAIAKAAYQAYVTKDRAALEAVLADDFHFTRPLDNRLDRGRLRERSRAEVAGSIR